MRLKDSKLEEIFEHCDVNLAAELLDAKLKLVLDELAPIRSVQTRANYAPWLEKETKQLQERRNKAHKKAAESGEEEGALY